MGVLLYKPHARYQNDGQGGKREEGYSKSKESLFSANLQMVAEANTAFDFFVEWLLQVTRG